MERIKGIRQKQQDASYSSLVPFGTDGQYIDMISELNLEYELKLGPKHIASIDNELDPQTGVVNEDITIIVENYASPEDVAKPNFSYYQVRTRIDGSGQTPEQEGDPYVSAVISANLYWMTNSGNDTIEKFIKGKTTTIYAQELQDTEEKQYTKYEIEEVYTDNN